METYVRPERWYENRQLRYCGVVFLFLLITGVWKEFTRDTTTQATEWKESSEAGVRLIVPGDFAPYPLNLSLQQKEQLATMGRTVEAWQAKTPLGIVMVGRIKDIPGNVMNLDESARNAVAFAFTKLEDVKWSSTVTTVCGREGRRVSANGRKGANLQRVEAVVFSDDNVGWMIVCGPKTDKVEGRQFAQRVLDSAQFPTRATGVP